MIWLRLCLRSIRVTRLRSICIFATTIVCALIFLSLSTASRILTGGALKNGRLITVASRTAPFVSSLDLRTGDQIKRIAHLKHFSPLALLAVSIGGDSIPTALVGVDVPQYLAMFNSVRLDAGATVLQGGSRGGALIGGSLADHQRIRVGSVIRLSVIKSFVPLQQDALPVTIVGIFRDPTGRTSERQILVDYTFLSEGVYSVPGLVSAFLIEASDGANPSALAKLIDTSMAASATPTVSGDQSVVVSSLVSSFLDVGRAIRVIGVLSSIVFFIVLTGAAAELLLRDAGERSILTALGFSRRRALSVSFAKWNIITLGGPALAAFQIGIIAVLFQAPLSRISPELMPTAQELTRSVLAAVVLGWLAFGLSLLATSRRREVW